MQNDSPPAKASSGAAIGAVTQQCAFLSSHAVAPPAGSKPQDSRLRPDCTAMSREATYSRKMRKQDKSKNQYPRQDQQQIYSLKTKVVIFFQQSLI
jgi:hypothetical protein